MADDHRKVFTGRNVQLAAVSISALLLACSGDKSGDWTAFFGERPPALTCAPAPPAQVDPAEGVSFDPTHMPCVELQIDPDDYAALQADTAFGGGLGFDEVFAEFGAIASQCDTPWPKEYWWYEANVTVDGVSLHQVGIRKKGFIGSLFLPVPSFKIKTDKFVDGQFLGDTERITLNANFGDAALMNTCLAYEIFAAAGYPAPLCNLVNVMVNNEPLGPYVHVEAIKKRFLRRAFGDDSGSLYEGTHTDFVEEWLPRFEVKTDDTDAKYGPLLKIAEALGKPDGELVEAFQSVLNMERFIVFWALEVLVIQTDGYNADHNNFYVYFDPSDNDRAVLIPWGIDKALSGDDKDSFGSGSYVTAELPRRLSRIPAISKLMEEELLRQATEVWDEDAILARIDQFGEQLKTAQDNEAHGTQVEALRAWVKNRPDQVTEFIAAGLPVGAAEQGSCMEGGGK